MKIGKYQISTFTAGKMALDGGAIFGVVPKELWAKENPADEKNRIPLSTNILLLQSDRRKILVDTGIGNSWNEKFSKIYGVDNNAESIQNKLNEEEIKPEEITDVILTHLHFDHTGGAVIKEGEKFIPAFPNATYHIQEKHFKWAMAPSEKDRASFIRERFMPLAENGLLKEWDGNVQLDDEIELILDHGHTFYQQLVKISDGNKTLFHAGDLVPLISLIPLPYIMAYDLMPLETLKHKKEILNRAVNEEWILYFQHDRRFSTATVQKNEKGFYPKEKFPELPND